VIKSVLATFGTRSKVFKAKNTIIKTFDLVPKVVSSYFSTRSKVANNAFDLVPKILSQDRMHY
jgi:hypothetical protein